MVCAGAKRVTHRTAGGRVRACVRARQGRQRPGGTPGVRAGQAPFGQFERGQ